MPITFQRAANANAPFGAVHVAMNGNAVGANIIHTTGVADCLVIILWDSTRQIGALAHLSYPAAAQHPAPAPMLDNSVEVRILNYVARHLDIMLGQMQSPPGNVDALLWRGHGFGRNYNLPQPNIVGNLSWRHFRSLEDLTAWSEGPGGYSLPFADCYGVIFDPATGQATFR